MSRNPNSVKGIIYKGLCRGLLQSFLKGVTRSSDYGSYERTQPHLHTQNAICCGEWCEGLGFRSLMIQNLDSFPGNPM